MKMIKYVLVCSLLINPLYASDDQRIEGDTFKLTKSKKPVRSRSDLSVPKDSNTKPLIKSTSLTLPKIPEDKAPTKRHSLSRHKEEALNNSSPMFQMTFWEVYFTQEKDFSGKNEWDEMTGPLLQRIQEIVGKWLEVTPDNKPCPEIKLFLVGKALVNDALDNGESKQIRLKRLRVDYALPLPDDLHTGDEILSIYYSKLKGGATEPESNISTMKRLVAWQATEGKKFQEIITAINSTEPLLCTPHESVFRPIKTTHQSKDDLINDIIKRNYKSESMSLDLSHQKMEPGEFVLLAPKLLSLNLIILNLYNVQIRYKDVVALAPNLPKTLLKLLLRKNRIGDIGVGTLSRYFPPLLEELDLSHNRMGNVALIPLSTYLPLTLRVFRLAYNNFDDEGITTFEIQSLKNLKELDLSGNKLGNKALKAISEKMSKTTLLLKINDTQANHKGIRSLMKNQSENLEYIELRGIQIGEKGLGYLHTKGFVESPFKMLPGLWMNTKHHPEILKMLPSISAENITIASGDSSNPAK